MAHSVYDDLAARFRDLARHHAREVSPPTMQFTVKAAAPLVIEQIDGDLVLEGGDPDFTVADTVDLAGPAIGDMILVEQTGPHDNQEWLATHVVKRGNAG